MVGLSGAAHAVPITYDINYSIGIGSITGTIATNGTTGTLATADVTGWNFTAFDGDDSFIFDGDESFQLNGAGFFATSDTLSFDFNAARQVIWGDIGLLSIWTVEIIGSSPGGSHTILHQDISGTFSHAAGDGNLSGTRIFAQTQQNPTEKSTGHRM